MSLCVEFGKRPYRIRLQDGVFLCDVAARQRPYLCVGRLPELLVERLGGQRVMVRCCRSVEVWEQLVEVLLKGGEPVENAREPRLIWFEILRLVEDAAICSRRSCFCVWR